MATAVDGKQPPSGGPLSNRRAQVALAVFVGGFGIAGTALQLVESVTGRIVLAAIAAAGVGFGLWVVAPSVDPSANRFVRAVLWLLPTGGGLVVVLVMLSLGPTVLGPARADRGGAQTCVIKPAPDGLRAAPNSP